MKLNRFRKTYKYVWMRTEECRVVQSDGINLISICGSSRIKQAEDNVIGCTWKSVLHIRNSFASMCMEIHEFGNRSDSCVHIILNIDGIRSGVESFNLGQSM